MAKKLFVGSIDWNATQEDLENLFSQYGEIEEAVIIMDKFSGRSKGFGFVTFVNDEDGVKAIEELDGATLKDRKIVVNEAKPREPRY